MRIGRELTGRDLTELDHFLTARWALGAARIVTAIEADEIDVAADQF